MTEPRENARAVFEAIAHNPAVSLEQFDEVAGYPRRREVEHQAWLDEGRARFGDDPRTWAVTCPGCGHAQTLAQVLELGGGEAFFAFSCIGRLRPASGTRPPVVGFGERDQGAGCTYAGGGLFRVNPVNVRMESGATRPTFEWAEVTLSAGPVDQTLEAL